ncbi:Di-copper centre-containing protein [Patellaria atrata CBS 101060]|uniref:Di-copper centre-containing protein n=1 Tax=Patellaria atrata CBS 101060 TaxID=1346257 RepID=A0A9P4S7W4_9PEZI|nr:Di-copper centre-containing protein [Patellaria atrata CBS 101060]
MVNWKKLSSALGVSLLLAPAVSGAPLVARGPDDELAAIALENAYKILDGTLQDGSSHTSCNRDNVVIRKEYGDLTTDERDDYTKAVKCLLNAPSKLSSSQYPGAKNRYDDFVIVHINMTHMVHGTANFLHWHRYYIWAYEVALRDECGYKGYQPYWNWGKYPDPLKSPIFNGDAHSMGGNGEYVAHSGQPLGMVGQQVPAGNGGGCVMTGALANTTVNVGPIAPSMDPKIGIPRNPRPDGYGYNPRCMRRDVTSYFTSQYLRPQDIAKHITSSKDQGVFQDTLQTDTRQAFSLHTAGHYTIWGDPAGDFYVSPADPAFWLHHGQVDRHWWIWQNQDPATRVQQYMGGTEWMVMNSKAGKLSDLQHLSIVAPATTGSIPSGQLVSTTAGPFCYVYQ